MGEQQPVEPTVSIVTVNRNHAAGLERTLASIDAQTYPHWQHVIQDGGSSDDSLAVAAARPDSRRSMISEPDGGIYQGMNLGLARAAGDLVWFVNSGDEINGADVLQHIVDSYRSQHWRWAYGNVLMLGVTPDQTHVYRRPHIKRRSVLTGVQTYPHPACIYERSLLSEIGDYRPEYGPPADQELCLRAERVEAPEFIDETLAIFEPGGSASGYSPRGYEALFRAIRADSGELTGGNNVLDLLSQGARLVYRYVGQMVATLRT